MEFGIVNKIKKERKQRLDNFSILLIFFYQSFVVTSYNEIKKTIILIKKSKITHSYIV
jgi:hypothetical protein